jgi:glutamine synthetase
MNLPDSIQQVRFAWADLHGNTRCKTLPRKSALAALKSGVDIVGTIALKDLSDRTAVPVFTPAGADQLPGFAGAANQRLVPDLNTLVELAWAPGTAWVLGSLHGANGAASLIDPRERLRLAVNALHAKGLELMVGLEVELHVYKMSPQQAWSDPMQAQWPHAAPQVQLLHPGYHLLSEQYADQCAPVLDLLQDALPRLGLPLRSIEIEFGPSQFELVFDPQPVQKVADNMVLLRSAVKQLLARHGYYATFVCRPPFANIMSSGWHIHQSVVDLKNGNNLFVDPLSGELSILGQQWLAGLIAHARSSAWLCVPTANAYARFKPNALAPTKVYWGRDDRAALLRLVGTGDATRVENRLPEPAANPHLALLAQLVSGLDGMERQLPCPPVGPQPDSSALFLSLNEALNHRAADPVLYNAVGRDLAEVIAQVKAQELTRLAAAKDQTAFEASEYFARL